MTTRNKNFETNKFAKAMDKLVEKTNKDLNLSNSDESYEEYTPRELEYIDKYKPLALYRMEDQELYEIITKHKFNDEKIQNEIQEFVKLINIKGDDYGWTVIDEGKKKKLFINDKSSKKEASNKQYQGYEESNQTYDSYNNKKYNSWNKYNSKYKNSNYNKNYYNKKNYNTQTYSEENPANKDEIIIQEVAVDKVNEEKNNRDTNNYAYKTNYYSSYNSYRGGRGKRGRGFNRGRYRNNNYSREDWIFEKEFNGSELKEVNGENTENKEERENQENIADNKNVENNQEENQVDEAPEDDFIEQETPAPQTQNEEATEVSDKTTPENKENVVVYETLRAEEIFENPALLNVKIKSVDNFAQNTEESQEIVSQSNKDALKNSSPIKESNTEEINKKKNTYNSFSEVVSSNVQNFSFLGNPANNTKQNPIESNVNSNNSSTKQQNNQQEFSIPSHQMNNSINNNKNENKFNLPNNNFNQPQANVNGNYQDFYNAYQMQLSALLAQNMPAGLGPQQMYPMPLVYYPPGGAVGNASDPSMNYGNFMPYMGYPMGYYVNPQQMAQQQQSNLKDSNDMQNKNRKINNFEYNSQQQLLQNTPYSPYLYMNSQYPMNSGVPMSGMNPGMGMNMMGYNFDQMSALNQMNMPSNYDPQNFNQKK